MTSDTENETGNEERGRGAEDPDDVLDEFEDDDAETRQARVDEASDIALAAPGGIIIERGTDGPDEEHFDAAHNP